MRRRARVLVAATLLFLLAALALVLGPPTLDLLKARAELDRPAEELTLEVLEDVRSRLDRADDRLRGTPTSVVKALPLVGTNTKALDEVAGRARDAVDAALELVRALETADKEGIFGGGQIDLETIEGLKAPLREQTSSLEELARTAREELDGRLVPPLWNALEGLRWRAEELVEGSSGTLDLFDLLPDLVGQHGSRRYLVLLVNNAELRGAGGVLAGVGNLLSRDGAVTLGRFTSIHQLRPARFTRVPAPEEYERRFGIYKANTTLWLNTTYSPDVPDVGLVAARLYRAVTGTTTHGALVVDPRGLEALLPPEGELHIPGSNLKVDGHELSRFVYSDAYEEFKSQRERRTAILRLGTTAIREILEAGLGSSETREAVGAAIAGGHLRFVSFNENEQQTLDRLDVTGELTQPVDDDVLVTIQNFGGGENHGSKLDYWTERHVGHTCVIQDDLSGTCATEITLENTVPDGLSRYVAGRPYGLLRSYLELYIPSNAKITSVSMDGAAVEFRPDDQAGYQALGVYLELAQGETTRIRFDYELPSDDAPFEFRLRPQPLARDAGVSLRFDLPRDGIWHGIGDIDGSTVSWRGTLDRELRGTILADTRSGIPSLWDAFGDFLREPLF